jgi:hypothetical protein
MDPPPDAFTRQEWPNGDFPPDVLEASLKQVNYDSKKTPLFVNGWNNHMDKSARRFAKHCETSNMQLPQIQMLVMSLYGQQSFDELWPTYVNQTGPIMNTIEYAQRNSMNQNPNNGQQQTVTLGLDSHQTQTTKQQIVPVMRRKIPTKQPDGTVIEIIEEVEMPQAMGQYPGYGPPQQGMNMESMMVAMTGMVASVAGAVGGPQNGGAQQPPPDPYDQMAKMAKAFKDMRGENTGEEGMTKFWMEKAQEMQEKSLEAQTEHLRYVAGEAMEDRNALAGKVQELEAETKKPIEQKLQDIKATVDAVKGITGQEGGEMTLEERQRQFDFSVKKWEHDKEEKRTDRLIDGIEKAVATPLNIISHKVGEAVGDSIAQKISGPTDEEEAEIDQAIAAAERQLLDLGGAVPGQEQMAQPPPSPPAGPSQPVSAPQRGPPPAPYPDPFIDEDFGPGGGGVNEEIALVRRRAQEQAEGWRA